MAGILAFVLAATIVAVAPSITLRVAAAAPSTIDWGKLTPGPGDTLMGPAPADTPMQVTLGLARDDAGLASFAADVSQPTSPRYRQYRDVATLAARYGIDEAAWSTIEADLTARGLQVDLDVTRSFAIANITVAEATALFGVSFELWNEAAPPPPPPPGGPTPPPSPPALYPAAVPSLPASMVGAVESVRGLSQWGSLSGTTWQARAAAPGATAPDAAVDYPFHPGGGGDPVRTGTPEGCQAAKDITFIGEPAGLAPNQLRTAYGADPLTAQGFGGAGARAAIVLDGPALASDLLAANACFAAPASPFFQHNPAGVGGADQNDEGALDVQMIAAMAPDLDRLDLVVPPTTIDPRDDLSFYAWIFAGPLDPAATGGQLPDVISSSMGVCEQAWQQPESQALVPLVEFILAMGVGAGTNWFGAAGDLGPSNCRVVPYLDYPATPSAVYPSSSPWVTSVGGTNLALNADNSIASSGAWNDLAMGSPYGNAGGGGTSTLFTRPAWQAGPGVPAGSMRVVPDVSHMAASFPGVAFVLDGSWSFGDGTSAATPMTAGMVATMIGALRADHQPRLGAMNPLLYALGTGGSDALRDITIGDTDLFAVGCCTATPGYDLASGWGSFDLTSLTAALRAPAVTLVTPPPAAEGEPITHLAAAVVPAGGVLRYDWDIDGDGVTDESTTTGSLVVRASAAATTVTVVAVTDLGRSGSAVATVTIRSATATPIAATPRFTG